MKAMPGASVVISQARMPLCLPVSVCYTLISLWTHFKGIFKENPSVFLCRVRSSRWHRLDVICSNRHKQLSQFLLGKTLSDCHKKDRQNILQVIKFQIRFV